MRRVLNRAARMLLTAGVLGLTQTAFAQDVLPPVPVPSIPPPPPAVMPPSVIAATPAVTTETGRQPIPLTRTSKATQTPTSPWPAAKTRSAVFATDNGNGAVNLLEAPTVPSSWAADTVRVKTPAQATKNTVEIYPTSVPQSSPAPPTGEPAPLPRFAPVPAADSEPVLEPAPKPAPKQTSATFGTQRAPVARKPESWPAAFVDPSQAASPPEVKTVAHQELAPKTAAATAAPAAPIVPSILQGKLARACGGLARSVKVTPQPDRSVVVHILCVNASNERDLVDRVMKVPEMGQANVRLELEVAP